MIEKALAFVLKSVIKRKVKQFLKRYFNMQFPFLSFNHREKTFVSQIFIGIAFSLLMGCYGSPKTELKIEKIQSSQEIQGLVASLYPNAAQVGVQVLKDGGTAADAASAMGFYLAVTEPSRVSLLGTGSCLISDADGTKEISFIQTIPETRLAIPGMARGLFTLHARAGQLGWQRILEPAILEAQNGFTVSVQLASDLERVQYGHGVGLSFGSFLPASEEEVKQGVRIKNPVLAQTLTQISEKGTGILYQIPYKTAFLEVLSAHHVSLVDGMLKGNKPLWDEQLPLITQAFVGPATVFAMDKNGLAVQCAFEMDSAFGSGYYVDEIGAFIADVPRKISDMNKTRVLSCPKGLTIQPENCQMNQTLLAEQKTKVVYE